MKFRYVGSKYMHFMTANSMLPVQGIPQLTKSAQEVFSTAGLVMEHLQEALSSSTGLLDSAWVSYRTRGFGSSAPSPFHFPFSFAARNLYNIHFNIYIYTYIYTYMHI
jgi:hypothetical protein